MRRKHVWIGVAMIVSGLARAEGEASVVELRETIGRIVEMESLRSQERTDWEARKATMAELLDLHRREIALLDEELEKSGGSADEHAARRDGKVAEIEGLREARDAVRQAVVRVRPRMLELAGRFPAPLADEVAADLATLRAWRDDGEPRPALQAILSLVGAAEQFNRRISRSSEVRDGREVEVLYLGLARAYYADRSGNGGVGVPAPGGWRWESRPELAAVVRNAFDQLDRKRPPALVELPVGLVEGGGR